VGRLGAGEPPRYVTRHPGPLSLLSSAGREMSTSQCSDAVWLKSKGSAWFISFVGERGGGR